MTFKVDRTAEFSKEGVFKNISPLNGHGVDFEEFNLSKIKFEDCSLYEENIDPIDRYMLSSYREVDLPVIEQLWQDHNRFKPFVRSYSVLERIFDIMISQHEFPEKELVSFEFTTQVIKDDCEDIHVIRFYKMPSGITPLICPLSQEIKYKRLRLVLNY